MIAEILVRSPDRAVREASADGETAPTSRLVEPFVLQRLGALEAALEGEEVVHPLTLSRGTPRGLFSRHHPGSPMFEPLRSSQRTIADQSCPEWTCP